MIEHRRSDITKKSVPDKASRRARNETLGLVAMALVVVASAAYAVSWSTGNAEADGGPGSSIQISEAPTLRPTVPSASSDPDDEALALGDTFSGSRASSTVTRVEVLPAPQALAAPDGQVWLGLRIKRCASETQSSAAAPWERWVAVDAEGDTYPGNKGAVPNGIVSQLLTTKDFPAGTCRSGWVVVAVPDAVSETIASVRFVPPSGPAAEWSVAG